MFEHLINEAAPASGNFVVGIRTGDAPAKFNARQIGAVLPRFVRGRTVCVAIASQDGRYFAENPYKIPETGPGLMYFDTPTKYPNAVNAFPGAEMAVSIRLAQSCDSADAGAYIPVMLAGAPAPRIQPLTVFVNADPEDIEVHLLRGQVPVGNSAKCGTNTSQIRIAFTSSCELIAPADLAQGGYEIEIIKRERFTSETSRIALFRD